MPARLLALLLLPPLHALHSGPTSAQEPTRPRSGAEDAGPSREQLALRALIELEGQFLRQPPRATRGEARAHFRAAHAAFGTFAETWRGSAASYKARMNQAALDHHFLGRQEAGLRELASVYEEIKARGAGFPKAASLTRGGVGLLLGERLLDSGDAPRAIEVYEEIASWAVAESATARRLAHRARRLADLAVGQPLPDFEHADWDGVQRSPADAAGRPLVLDFWVSWARPCAATQAVLREVRHAHPDRLAVLGLCLDPPERRVGVRALAERRGLDWPQLQPEGGFQSALAERFQVRRVPFNLLVDAQGIIRGRDLGPEQLRAALEALFAPADATDEAAED